MDKINHADMVAALVKPDQDIKDSITPEECDLLHMAVGVAGEAGELLDAVKKHIIYRKPLDMVNMKEELGDLEFYMERIRQICKFSREEVLEANIEKLMTSDKARYKLGKYTDDAAQNRADKESGE